jgi:hypothetical protein
MPKENLDITASPSADSLQEEKDTTAAASPENAEQIYFAKPGKFQLRK